jgi:UDP-glucose 4-epimerase
MPAADAALRRRPILSAAVRERQGGAQSVGDWHMRVVVTGGAGFVGSHVCAALISRAEIAEVVVIDDLSTGRAANVSGCGSTLVVGSVLDSALLDRVIPGADAVVHLAAAASVPGSLSDPVRCNQVNVGGTVRVLEAARRAGCRHVVLASSSAVYGDGTAAVKDEQTPAEPVTPYAVSKLAAEWYAAAYARCFDMHVLVLRLFNAYGPGQSAGREGAGVIARFLHAAQTGEPLPLCGDGNQVRDFVFVGTVAEVVADAVCRHVTSPTPVNVASGVPRSLLEVVSELESQLGRTLTVERQSERPGDLRESRADTGRMRELFPTVRPVEFDEGLRCTLADAMESQPAGISAIRRQTSRRPRALRRAAVALAAVATVFWTGTYGVRLAVAHGLDTIKPDDEQGLYIVVQPAGDLDQQTIRLITTINAAVAVDGSMIRRHPATVQQLAAAGVVVVNAGRGRPFRTGLVAGRSAILHTANAITTVQGHAPRLFLTGSDLDAVDLGMLMAKHEKIIVPDRWSNNGDIPPLHRGEILLLGCTDTITCKTALETVERRAAALALRIRPLVGGT